MINDDISVVGPRSAYSPSLRVAFIPFSHSKHTSTSPPATNNPLVLLFLSDFALSSCNFVCYNPTPCFTGCVLLSGLPSPPPPPLSRFERLQLGQCARGAWRCWLLQKSLHRLLDVHDDYDDLLCVSVCSCVRPCVRPFV